MLVALFLGVVVLTELLEIRQVPGLLLLLLVLLGALLLLGLLLALEVQLVHLPVFYIVFIYIMVYL